MVTSLVAGVVAALLYGIATVMQAVAVREASTRELGVGGGDDPGLLVRMLSQWRFVASICLDALGFVAQLVALQRLPLFAVQAMVAANLAVIAVLASVLIGVALSWREWVSGGIVGGGRGGPARLDGGRRGSHGGRGGVQARAHRRHH